MTNDNGPAGDGPDLGPLGLRGAARNPLLDIMWIIGETVNCGNAVGAAAGESPTLAGGTFTVVGELTVWAAPLTPMAMPAMLGSPSFARLATSGAGEVLVSAWVLPSVSLTAWIRARGNLAHPVVHADALPRPPLP